MIYFIAVQSIIIVSLILYVKLLVRTIKIQNTDKEYLKAVLENIKREV